MNWKSFKYLKLRDEDNWGNVSKINLNLLLILDELLFELRQDYIITSGNTGMHSPFSWHYQNRAVDIIFPSTKKEKLPDIFLTALRYPFSGYGLYPEWWVGNKKNITGGMHLEVEPVWTRKKYWLETQGKYIGIDFENLKNFF